jgi:hypothetical protein
MGDNPTSESERDAPNDHAPSTAWLKQMAAEGGATVAYRDDTFYKVTVEEVAIEEAQGYK